MEIVIVKVNIMEKIVSIIVKDARRMDVKIEQEIV